jgi:hypothetical protein
MDQNSSMSISQECCHHTVSLPFMICGYMTRLYTALPACLSEIITFELWFVLQTQRLQPNSTVMSSILRMWQSEGARGLFAGNGANVARVFPYAALICLTYSNLCKANLTA